MQRSRQKRRLLPLYSFGAAFLVFGTIASISFIGRDSSANVPAVLALDSTGKRAPRYLGVTSAYYSGNLGGPMGANAKCQVNYAGSHMCNQRELLRSGATSISAGWINCDAYLGTATYQACLGIYGSAWSNGTTNYSCNQWQSGTSANRGPYVLGASGGISDTACNASLPILCCSD